MNNETGSERNGAVADQVTDRRGHAMRTADDVAELLRLKACSSGAKRKADHLGCSYHTVKGTWRAGGVKPFKTARAKQLAGLDDWLRERFLAHRGNADVVRQELSSEQNIQSPFDSMPPSMLRAASRTARPTAR